MRKIALSVLFLASASVAYAQIVPTPAPPPAAPSATVGTAAVPGTSSSYMRADAAPAINQAITPTWTGAHAFTSNVTVQGLLSSTNNTTAAGPTNSGVALSAAPDVADALFFDASQTANNRTYEVLAFQGGLNFRFKNDAGNSATTWLKASGGQAAGITGITSNSGSGTWSHTGNMNVSGTFNATGTLGSSANNAIPSPTNSGVTIGGGSNWANAQFYDQAATANNRTAAFNWSGGVFSFWFRSDAGTALTALAVSGGQGNGITGITSNSGSGAWVHTGAFVANSLQAKTVYTVATLPTCNAGAEGTFAAVSDAAASPVYNATAAGSGSVHLPVYCNGTNWTNH